MIERKVLVKTTEIEIVEFHYLLDKKKTQEVIYLTPISSALDQAVDLYAGNRLYSHYSGCEDNKSKFFKRLIVIDKNGLN